MFQPEIILGGLFRQPFTGKSNAACIFDKVIFFGRVNAVFGSCFVVKLINKNCYQTFASSKSAIEILEKGVKYAQS